ncbi:hypothetical protein [Actinomadura sp. CNU-125]|uniref:beta-xylosidase family glycoside hydrolase n=1 Tax=Actinomadura sp. CNU-125 TaxID=1904961 RepID=UPI0021CC7F68|nr:hypothetical protein [Actinomadura sp. CNU-125]
MDLGGPNAARRRVPRRETRLPHHPCRARWPRRLPAGFRRPRQRHHRSVFETGVDASEGRGGLGLRYNEEFTITLTAERAPSGSGTRITAGASLPTLEQSWSAEVGGDKVLLRIETDLPRGTPPWSSSGDRIRLVVADDTGTEHRLAELDGRFWSVETAAPFTGRVTGMFAEKGVVRFAEFRYRGTGRS